jgi:hypothetical protein
VKFLHRFHLHPYLVGLFPVLSLYAHNQGELDPDAPWRSLAVILVGTTVILLLLRLYFKDWSQASFITTYASLIFFLYTPLREILHNVHAANFNLGWNRYFLPLWLLGLVLGIWVIVKKLPRTESTVQLFNVVALSTLLLPLFSIVSYNIGHSSIQDAQQINSLVVKNEAEIKNRPDIYYIILDMYGRSDTIEEEFGYDNSQFLNELRDQGFYVASCSTSNYSHTVLSVTSSLNMDFLPAFEERPVAGDANYFNAATAIRNNAVRRYLQTYGYSFVSFESFFPYLNIPDSDVYLRIPEKKDNIQPFELLLIEQTPVKILIEKLSAYRSQTAEGETIRIYGSDYDRTLFVFETLPELPTTLPGPTFVYAHLFVPHPPYVFGPNGEYVGNNKRYYEGPYRDPVDESAYHQAYTDQLRYINSVLPGILDRIISTSKIKPIIIVQGDHGFWGDAYQRLPILNAYYLPGQDANQLLYSTITPVNSFRVILQAYFNAELGLLPDKNYPTLRSKDYYDVNQAEQMEKGPIKCNPK